MPTKQRVWLITGSSSGFGREMVTQCLANDDIVVATLRKPEVLAELATQYPTERLLVLKLDVTNQQEVVDAFAAAKKAFGRVDVVYNNAGQGFICEVECASISTARSLFDVNFWGVVNVSLEAVRFFRDENLPGVGGTLLQVSSLGGIGIFPCGGFYVASKHAMNGFTSTLSEELDPAWNIKVITLTPGWYRTPIIDHSLHSVVPASAPYASNPALSSTVFRKNYPSVPDLPTTGDPAKYTQVVRSVVDMAEPPTFVPLGLDVVATMKAKIAEMQNVLDKFGHLSDDLLFNDRQ